MLAELLVPIFLPGIAFLAVLLVLKPEQRGRWSGLVGGFVLPLATLVGLRTKSCLALVLFRLAPLALDLGRGGFALGGVVLVAFRRPWVVCPTGLGALAGFFGAFPDMEISDQCSFWASVLWSPSNGGCWPLKPRWVAWSDLGHGFRALPWPRWPSMGDSRRS